MQLLFSKIEPFLLQQLHGEYDSLQLPKSREAVVAHLAWLLWDKNPNFSKEQSKAMSFFSDPMILHHLLFESMQFLSENTSNKQAETQEHSISEASLIENRETEISTENPITTESNTNVDSSTSDESSLTTENPFVPISDIISSTSNIEDDLNTSETSKTETLPENPNKINQPEQEVPEPTEEEIMSTKIGSILSHQLAEFQKEVKPDQLLLPDLADLPEFTRDFFKSQGITLSENAESMKKVRKFTDWIRHMKTINSNPTDLGSSAEEELAVAAKAEISNRKVEILTVSMVEVLVRQGKKEEAKILLQKLSLLNPDKSTIFADKLKSLNI